MKIKMNENRRIYKLHSSILKKNKWDINLPLDETIRNHPDYVVTIGDSQCLRFIDEINGINDASGEIKEIKSTIKNEKRKKVTSKTKTKIKELYANLYHLQFIPDYVEIIMDCISDYDKANAGFTINGVIYSRLLGTNGGIKKSTIVYVNKEIYPELKRRLDNGRDMSKELVPAKLEAYQALICSGSTPIPEPNGIIVVNDCITHFKENIILINDENDGEPIMTEIDNYEVEHNDSDGYGLMLPGYSRRVNEYLTGDGERTISGMNTRYAWTKGMLYTFDFLEFAEKVAGSYEVIDAWGDKRDIRNAEVIITVSMLKLWDSYKSWEDYYDNCKKNNYQFSTPKICPSKLENQRTTNYQFLNPIDMTDDEIQRLCQPTIDEIKDVISGDYRKAIAYLTGGCRSDIDVSKMKNDYVKALMICPKIIDDTYVQRNICRNIQKQIDNAKKGTIAVMGNYAMIGGDPYALAQSIFGLEVTGLLKAGEVYHRFWIDRGADDIVCFRAPMTCANNIRRVRLCKSAEALYWFRFITTAQIINAWDTMSDAMNGEDFDGDTNFCTDNDVILNKTQNLKTIMCVQRKAAKKIPSESDIIKANKLAFNDDIGIITNHITSMFDVRAAFSPESEEFKTLTYRILCGQNYQQASIDRAKGVISKPMPSYWYNVAEKDADNNTDINRRIVANKKPYFMKWVYPTEKTKYETYIKNCNSNVRRQYRTDIAGLMASASKTDDMITTLQFYEILKPLTDNGCTVNRICHFVEDAFSDVPQKDNNTFDYSVYQNGVTYTKQMRQQIEAQYYNYINRCSEFAKFCKENTVDKDKIELDKLQMIDDFRAECDCICPDDIILCDIVLDICYGGNKNKAFAWDICGEQIIINLLNHCGGCLEYPIATDDDNNYDFCFSGTKFAMKKERMDI